MTHRISNELQEFEELSAIPDFGSDFYVTPTFWSTYRAPKSDPLEQAVDDFIRKEHL